MIAHHRRYAPRLASLNELQTLIVPQAQKLTGDTPEGLHEIFVISARDAIDLMGHASEANSNRVFPPLTTLNTSPEVKAPPTIESEIGPVG